MCRDCGCGQLDQVTISGGNAHVHHHHHHQHQAGGHVHGPDEAKALLLEHNSRVAVHNRQHFDAHGVLCVNLISAPGSGKTTLLERLIADWPQAPPIKVIQGDLATDNDAERIRRAGVEAIQVNTGQGCHLDAEMIHQALHRLDLPQDGLLIIENVGNLVCPADFDLGEHHKIAVIACTEGDDKPAKYPNLIRQSSILLINKIDLLAYLDFDIGRCCRLARRENPDIAILEVSATTGEGLDQFARLLEESQQKNRQEVIRG